VLALVRTHGLALSVALVLVLMTRRRWRAVVFSLAGLAVTVGPWEIWLSVHRQAADGILRGSYGPYGAWLAAGMRGHVLNFVSHTMFVNARDTGATLADHFAIADTTWTRLITSALTVGAVVVGAWRLARRAPVFVAFAVVYTLVLLAWPFAPWRFVFAAWPVVVLCIGGAIECPADAATRRTVSARALRLAAALPIVLLVAGAVREEGRAYATHSWTRPMIEAMTQIAPLVGWVRARTAPDDVVAADGEQLIYLFANRRAVPIAPFTAAEYLHPRTAADNAASIRQLLDEYPVKYLLTVSPALRASADLVATMPGGGARAEVPTLVRVALLNDGGVYRVERRAETPMESQR